MVAVEEEPSSMDPRAGSDQASDRLYRLLYRGLFKTGPRLEAEPDLAASWERLDAMRYRVLLRPGVRFSDGRPLTAADAVFTLRSLLNGSVPSYRRGDLERVARVAATGPLSLELTLKEPYAPILHALDVGVVPEGTSPRPDLPPPGCGPYRLRERVTGQWVMLEANPYADPPPRTPTLALKVVPDPVVRGLELRRGSADLVVNDLPPDSVAYFRRAGYLVVQAPGSNYAYLGFHCGRPPLDRPAVRHALALAMNRGALLRHLYRGLGREATGLLCPENWAFEPAEAAPYDPARAAALLDAEGLVPGPGGVRLRLLYKTSQNKISRLLAAAVQQDLRRVGVEATLVSLEWGTFYGDIQRGDFDLFGLTWVGLADPDAFRLRFASAAAPPAGMNRGRYANARVDALVEAGAREADPQKRREIYAEVQRILARETPYVSLWWPDNVAVGRPGLAPFTVPPDGSFAFLAGVGWNGGAPPP